MPVIKFERMFPELAVPRPTIYSTASWWKQMERYDETIPSDPDKVRGHAGDTIRGCPAVEDIINSGYMLFAPADIHVNAITDELHYAHPANFLNYSGASEKYPYLSHHEKKVMDGYNATEFNLTPLRVHPYWAISTEEGYSTMFIHPQHREDLPFRVISAIVDTDALTVNTSFSILIKKGFKGLIPKGTPIVQVFPFKREDWQMEIAEFDELKFRQDKAQMASVFERPYKRLFWTRKRYK